VQELLVAGFEPLFQEGPGVVGMLEVAVAFVTARVFGHALVLVIERQPVRINLADQGGAGQRRGHGVTVGFQEHAEAAVNRQRAHRGHIVRPRRHRLELELFLLEERQRCLVVWPWTRTLAMVSSQWRAAGLNAAQGGSSRPCRKFA